ncbi:MAG: TIGR03546 family protein [Deltaproteobacteria bacterium]|nr:TIGR03546 family protein [Deltaproteobacteria bacterium]
MLIILKMAGKILKVLKDGGTPGQIAAGFTFGFVMGLTPGWPLQVWILLLLTLLFNVNLTMVMVATAIAAMTGWIFDPVLDWTGSLMLENIAALKGLYTVMYNNPFLMTTRFNNTVVMGGLVAGLLIAAPLYFLCRWGVIHYREQVLTKMETWKIVKLFKATPIYGLYLRLENMGLIR